MHPGEGYLISCCSGLNVLDSCQFPGMHFSGSSRQLAQPWQSAAAIQCEGKMQGFPTSSARLSHWSAAACTLLARAAICLWDATACMWTHKHNLKNASLPSETAGFMQDLSSELMDLFARGRKGGAGTRML